jgi:DNA polymerase III delta subunit
MAQKLNELLDFFKSKFGETRVYRIEKENFNKVEFEELMKSRTLFENKIIVVCGGLLEEKNLAEFIMENFGKCSKSENVFIFTESELDEKFLNKIKKEAEKSYEFKLLSGAKLEEWVKNEINIREAKIDNKFIDGIIKECGSDLWCASKEIEKLNLSDSIKYSITDEKEYNPFAICDAIAEKNKLKAWILLQKAIMAGVSAEEVFWKVNWQVKNLLLIKKLSQTPRIDIVKESGLHPFVVKKNLWSIKNFSEEELINFSSQLVNLYHNTRRGLTDFEVGLERLLIE